MREPLPPLLRGGTHKDTESGSSYLSAAQRGAGTPAPPDSTIVKFGLRRDQAIRLYLKYRVAGNPDDTQAYIGTFFNNLVAVPLLSVSRSSTNSLGQQWRIVLIPWNDGVNMDPIVIT